MSDADTTNGVWHVTVSELAELLREALRAVAPIAARAQIPYGEETAYDDWDNIAQCLYNNIVVRSVRFARGMDQSVILPNYAMLYERFDAFDAIIQVTDPSKTVGGPIVFHSFVTRDQPFDTVRGVKLQDDHETATSQRFEGSAATVGFSLLVRRGGSGFVVEELDVEL